MSKEVLGPIKAVFKSCPEDSKVYRQVGTQSDNFSLYKSNTYKDKYYGFMYYTLGLEDDPEVHLIMNIPGYVKTSYCDLEIKGNDIILNREKGGCFVFTVLDETMNEEKIKQLIYEKGKEND